jgi:hypothetical protein
MCWTGRGTEMAGMNEHTGKQDRISVFLVDDHEIFRRGIRDLLAHEPDMDVIG